MGFRDITDIFSLQGFSSDAIVIPVFNPQPKSPPRGRRKPKPLKRSPLKRGAKKIRGRTQLVHVRLDADGIAEVLSSCHPASCVNVGAIHEVRAVAVGVIRQRVFQRAAGQCERVVDGVRCKNRPKVLHEWQHRGRQGHQSLENCGAICETCHTLEHPEKQISKLQRYPQK